MDLSIPFFKKLHKFRVISKKITETGKPRLRQFLGYNFLSLKQCHVDDVTTTRTQKLYSPHRTVTEAVPSAPAQVT